MYPLQDVSLMLNVSKTTLYKYFEKYKIQITKQKNLSFISEHEYNRLVNSLKHDSFYLENNANQYTNNTKVVQTTTDDIGAEESPKGTDKDIIDIIKDEITAKYDSVISDIKSTYEKQLEISNEEIKKRNAVIEQKEIAISQHMENAQRFAIKVKDVDKEKVDLQSKYELALRKYYNVRTFFVVALFVIIVLAAFMILSSK